MINGAHVVIYSKDAEADRTFLRDVLQFDSVDAGHGWLLFALPPTELAFHPADDNDRHALYLMCDNLAATMAELRKRNVQFSEVQEERWGTVTRFGLPGGGTVGLYEAHHPRPSHR